MSSLQYCHPEFGYFCPAPSLRRKVRLALACVVLVVIAGTAGNIAMKAAQDSGSKSAFARVDGVAADKALSGAVGAAAIATVEGVRPPEGGKSECEQGSSVDQTWAYLDGKCVSGRTRRARAARAAGSRQATAVVRVDRDTPSSAAGAADRRQQDNASTTADATQPAARAGASDHASSSGPRRKAQRSARRHSASAGRDGRRRDGPVGHVFLGGGAWGWLW